MSVKVGPFGCRLLVFLAIVGECPQSRRCAEPRRRPGGSRRFGGSAAVSLRCITQSPRLPTDSELMDLIVQRFGGNADAVHLGTIYEAVAQRYPDEMAERRYPASGDRSLRACIRRSLSKLKDQGLAENPNWGWWRIGTP